MCSVKNFRVGQFLRNTWGRPSHSSPLGRHRSERFKFPSLDKRKGAPVCSVKNFRVGQFLRNTRGLSPHFHRTMEFKPI